MVQFDVSSAAAALDRPLLSQSFRLNRAVGPETEQWADELTDEQMASRQQAVGFSKAGYQEDLQRIFSTGCAKIDDGEVYWRGIFPAAV